MANEQPETPKFFIIPTETLQKASNILVKLPYDVVGDLIAEIKANIQPVTLAETAPEATEPEKSDAAVG